MPRHSLTVFDHFWLRENSNAQKILLCEVFFANKNNKRLLNLMRRYIDKILTEMSQIRKYYYEIENCHDNPRD